MSPGRMVVATTLTLLVIGPGALHGRSRMLATPPAATGSTATAPDPWGFPEDDVDSSWTGAVRQQARDLGLLGTFLSLALVSFARKSAPLKYVTLGAAVVYLGFLKSQIVSVANLFALIDWNLPIVKYSLAWYVLVLFTIGSAVLWGRFYCGRICAFGAVTQLMAAVVPDRVRIGLSPRLERRAAWAKYVVLGATLGWYVVKRDVLAYRYVEPFWMFTMNGSPVLWVALGMLLLATVFVRNLYCRFLCPVGAALALLSNLTVFRIRRWTECDACTTCERGCGWAAVRGQRVLVCECVRCDDCERLSTDIRRCPHWMSLRTRKGATAGA